MHDEGQLSTFFFYDDDDDDDDGAFFICWKLSRGQSDNSPLNIKFPLIHLWGTCGTMRGRSCSFFFLRRAPGVSTHITANR